MTTHNKTPKAHGENEPLYIHLGDDEDEDEHDVAEVHDAEEHDDDGVEVIRPHARTPNSSSTRGRGLRNQPQVAEDEEELPPSKTKIKKQMHELRDLGKELTELGKDQIAQLDIPENLRDAIREMKNINKFGAQRRQMQYIGKLMRSVDTAPIQAALDEINGVSAAANARQHALERLRVRLLEDEAVIGEIVRDHPGADMQQLRQLRRNALKEQEHNKPPRAFREIFRVLRELTQESPHDPDDAGTAVE